MQLSYGRDSIKKNGIYDQVMELLKEAGKTVFEDPGVMPNPTVEKLYEGCKIARENEVDLILAKFILSPPDILIYSATLFHFLILVRKVPKGATVLT